MNFYKKNIPKEIRISLLFSVVLIIFRIMITDSTDFIYLLWNILLAFIPFLISTILFIFKDKLINKNYLIYFILGGIVWLIFFPNAPYLVTDLIHLGEGSYMPLWYDGIMLFFIAILGIVLSFYSLYQIEQIILNKFSKKITNVSIIFIIFLTSFGIYLGRFIRLNSWDLFLESKETYASIWNIFKNQISSLEAGTYTLLFFITFIFSFYFWKYQKAKKNDLC